MFVLSVCQNCVVRLRASEAALGFGAATALRNNFFVHERLEGTDGHSTVATCEIHTCHETCTLFTNIPQLLEACALSARKCVYCVKKIALAMIS